MNQPSPDYTTQDLLAFYDRVKPVLAEWLAKPIWTTRETALLCAGYVPHDAPEYEKSARCDQLKSIQEGVPIDPLEYVPPNYQAYSEYLMLLTGKEAAPPRDMVQLLRPTGKRVGFVDEGRGKGHWVEVRTALHLGALQKLQWFFMIGNAVGLQVPALVPFGLLDRLSVSGRLTDQPASDSATATARKQPEVTSVKNRVEKGEPPVITGVFSSEATPKAMQRKLRERQPQQTTPEERRYHTTEEVAGLTNLLPDTLNKYAREGRLVEGFTPFKRQNGRCWLWRDDQQQAAYEISTTADKPKHRVK